MNTLKRIVAVLLFTLSGLFSKAGVVDSASHQPGITRSIDMLMTRIFSPRKGHPSGNLVNYDDGDDLQQQYVNGATPLYGDDVKAQLLSSLGSFNTGNAANGVQLFAFTGRYYLGYSDMHGPPDTNAAVQKIMNNLSAALQTQNGGKGSKDIFRKEFIKVIDDQYAAFQQKATALNKPKVIVLFYVEAVIGYDYLINNTIKPAQKKRYYCFIWTGGMDVLEQTKLSTSLSAFQQLLHVNAQTGLINPQGLVSCTDKINDLYKSTADYDDPANAIRLVWNLSADQLKALTVADRMRLLRAMNKASLTDVNNMLAGTFNMPGATGEEAVLKVLTSTPAGDGDALIDSLNTLNTDKKSFLVSLFYKLDDGMMIGAGNPSRSEYLKAVRDLLINGNNFKNRLTALFDGNNILQRVIHWDPSYLTTAPPLGSNKYDISLNDDGAVTVARSYVKSYTISFTSSNREETISQMQLTPSYDNLAPYTLQSTDLVLINNNSGLGSLSQAGLAAGDRSVVPALFLKLINDKQFNADLLSAIAITASAVTVLTGPTALVTAASQARQAWVVFEIANAMGNLTLNSMQKELAGSKFETVVNYSNLVMVAVGSAQLTAGSIKALPQALDAVKSIGTVLQKELALRFVASMMRVEQDLTDMQSVNSVKEMMALRDAIVKDWKAANNGEDLVAEAQEYNKSAQDEAGSSMVGGSTNNDISYFLNSYSKRPSLTAWVINETGASKAQIYDLLSKCNNQTLDAMEQAINKYSGIKTELLGQPDLIPKFNKLYDQNGVWYKYRLRYNQLSKTETLPANFGKVLTDMPTIPNQTLGTYATTTTLGKAFDLDIVENYIKTNKADQLPGFMDQLRLASGGKNDFFFESQLNLKMAGKSATPDIVAFEHDAALTIDKNKGYLVDCKIDVSTGWSGNQKELVNDYVGSGQQVEVRSAAPTYLHTGDKVILVSVLQISVDDNGLLVIKVK